MRKSIVSLLVILLFVGVTMASAQTPEITNGLAYLSSTQNPDGSWGDEETSTDILPATVSVIETLQVLDETGTINYSNATAWLQEQSIETTEYLSERIHALSVGGSDIDLLNSYIDELYYAWGGHDDYEVNNLDTTLAIQAPPIFKE